MRQDINRSTKPLLGISEQPIRRKSRSSLSRLILQTWPVAYADVARCALPKLAQRTIPSSLLLSSSATHTHSTFGVSVGFCPFFPSEQNFINPAEILWLSGGEGGGRVGGVICNRVQRDRRCGPAPPAVAEIQLLLARAGPF